VQRRRFVGAQRPQLDAGPHIPAVSAIEEWVSGLRLVISLP
jgi:hypothetical protein